MNGFRGTVFESGDQNFHPGTLAVSISTLLEAFTLPFSQASEAKFKFFFAKIQASGTLDSDQRGIFSKADTFAFDTVLDVEVLRHKIFRELFVEKARFFRV